MATQTLQKWNKVKLGDVTEIESGGTPSSAKSEYWDGGNICWATLPDLKNKYLFDTQRKITPLGLKNSSAKLLPINSVIFSSRATIGEVSIAKVEISTNQGSKNFICNPTKIDYEFLYYLLKSKVEEINSLASGATYKEINKTVFSSVEVEIPNISTQKQIAQVLAVYDDLIYNNARRIQVLEQMAQVVYTEWFVNFRFPGYEKVKMVDSGTDFGKIPEGWEIKRIGDVFIVKYGNNLPKTKIAESGEHPVYGAGGVIGFYGEKNVDEKTALITSRGNGSGTVWRTKGAGFVTNNSFTVVGNNEHQYLDMSFIYNTLLNANIGSSISGSAQPQVTINSLNYVEVVVPEKNLVENFQSEIYPLYILADKLFLMNHNLRQTRDLLLPKLVTGKIRI